MTYLSSQSNENEWARTGPRIFGCSTAVFWGRQDVERCLFNLSLDLHAWICTRATLGSFVLYSQFCVGEQRMKSYVFRIGVHCSEANGCECFTSDRVYRNSVSPCTLRFSQVGQARHIVSIDAAGLLDCSLLLPISTLGDATFVHEDYSTPR